MPTPRSANSSNACTTKNGCTRHWAIGRRPSSSSRRRGCHEVAPRRHACLGAPPPNPWDLPLSGQNGCRRNARFWRWPKPPPAIPATESALGLRPRRALSSAQPPPEWTTSTLPCNTFAANGNYPLTDCLTFGVHFSSASPSPLTPLPARTARSSQKGDSRPADNPFPP